MRGTNLDVNGLIHLPGLGDFQMFQIDALPDPYTITNSVEGDRVARIVAKCDPNKQESLDSENVADPMDAEQTWPTEEEMKMVEEQRKVTYNHEMLSVKIFNICLCR